MPLVARPRVEAVDRTRLASAETAKLLDGFRACPSGSLWVVMLASGQRWSEIAALRWSDLDRSDGLLRIAQHVVRNHGDAAGASASGRRHGRGWTIAPLTKTGRTLDVAMADFGWEVIAYEREQAELRGEPTDDGLIWHPDGDRSLPLPDSTSYNRWMRFCHAYGLPTEAFRQNDLRHTAGHALYAMTGDIKLVQDQLGHADIRTTAGIYARGRVDARLRIGLAAYGAWARSEVASGTPSEGPSSTRVLATGDVQVRDWRHADPDPHADGDGPALRG